MTTDINYHVMISKYKKPVEGNCKTSCLCSFFFFFDNYIQIFFLLNFVYFKFLNDSLKKYSLSRLWFKTLYFLDNYNILLIPQLKPFFLYLDLQTLWM